MFVGENAIEHERLNVAVENDADEFVRLVHDRAAAVAADDVGVGNEIEWRVRDSISLCARSNVAADRRAARSCVRRSADKDRQNL